MAENAVFSLLDMEISLFPLFYVVFNWKASWSWTENKEFKEISFDFKTMGWTFFTIF